MHADPFRLRALKNLTALLEGIGLGVVQPAGTNVGPGVLLVAGAIARGGERVDALRVKTGGL